MRGGKRWSKMPADVEHGRNKVWYVKRVSNSRSIMMRGKTYDSALTMGPQGVEVTSVKKDKKYAHYGIAEMPGWAVDGVYFILKVVGKKGAWKEKVFECRDVQQAESLRDELERIVDHLVSHPEEADPVVYDLALREKERRDAQEKDMGGSDGEEDDEWEKVYTDEGQPYFFNPTTNETAWERPPPTFKATGRAVVAAVNSKRVIRMEVEESPAGATASPPATPAQEPLKSGDDWEESVTPDGKSFWHSRATGKSTWDMPDEVKAQKEQQAVEQCRGDAVHLCTQCIIAIEDRGSCDKEQIRTELNELASAIRAVVFRLDNAVAKTRRDEAALIAPSSSG